MNAVKAIQTSFPLTQPSFPRPIRFPSSRRKPSVCFCNSPDDDPESAGSSSSSDGDKRKQELLARIAMLQTQKVRLTDFLDERSACLTQFAEDANAQFDEIGENALKELDDASARVKLLDMETDMDLININISSIDNIILKIMEKLEGRMQEFEESSDINREEIEGNERVLEEFEDQIVRDRNEGLFFKSLQEKAPQSKATASAEARAEAEKLKELARNSAGSKLRKNIYLCLMSLLAIGMANATFATADIEWRKVAALGLIFMGLLSQFIYEQSLSSSAKEIDKKEK